MRAGSATYSATSDLRLWLRIVPAFAAGYFLSYALRTVNAVIAPELMSELRVSAADLGLLTAAYFLGFGCFQLPLGVLLDRFGPRRVEASLLLVAAAGCALFGLGRGLDALAAARALIGLGVSACLMAGFKAFSQWFASERLPALNGTLMVAGGLGALCASVPVTAALPWLGWRGVFFVLSGLLVLAAGFLMTVPDPATDGRHESIGDQIRALGGVFGSRSYWRFAPQGALVIGGFMALQGLWAVPWMMTVNGHSRAVAADVLFLMGLAMLLGFLFVATCTGWLARRGLSPMALLVAGMGLALLIELAIVFDVAGAAWLWPFLGLSFSLGNIAYSQLTMRFPLALAGRVNTALNLAVFAGAFGLQWGLGLAIDALATSGLPRPEAFRLAFGGLLAMQALAFGWFLLPDRARTA